MTQQYVVLGDSELVMREVMDTIQGQTFRTEQQLRSLFKSEILIYSMVEFVDMVNDCELDILTGYWMTYVYLKL